ncbi:amidohydrolase family protein [Dermacoccaceae bacterium W4C1]
MDQVLHVQGQILAGPSQTHGELWVVEGRVTYERPPASLDTITLTGWVLPGLVDAHCHVGMDPEHGIDADYAQEQAITDRDAGALLLRDAGSPVDTSWMHEREDMPALIRAGRHIARTRRYIRGLAHEIEPEDLVEYVRTEARGSDGWVKLVGDWIDRDAGDLGPCWPIEAAREAIAAAHAEGARVTAHCFGEQSLWELAEAGIDCIEHATGLQTETIDLFAERGIGIVPTLVNIANFPGFADAGEAKFPAYAQHMRRLHETRHEVIGAAHEAGIPIFCGTDAGGQMPHGLVADEVIELHKAGLDPTAALDAATWAARAWLGRPSLAEGDPADLVVFSGDPRADLTELKRPEHVVLRGRSVA